MGVLDGEVRLGFESVLLKLHVDVGVHFLFALELLAAEEAVVEALSLQRFKHSLAVSLALDGLLYESPYFGLLLLPLDSELRWLLLLEAPQQEVP